METLLMKGKPVADAYRKVITEKIEAAKQRGVVINLTIVIIGDDQASHVYKDRLVKLAESLGATAKVVEMPAETTQEEAIAAIKRLNHNRYVTGMLLMMPLPKHIDGEAVGSLITINKDIDCINPKNAGTVFFGSNVWAACTPRACMATLKHYGIELEGKHAVVLGRSNVVGKPVAMLLLQENATVTICHSRTKDLAAILQQADIIIAAVGVPAFVKADMVKEGVVIVDVGINSVDGELVGDVDPAACAKASAYTPVPGGIGVVSNMMVMDTLSRNL